MVDFLDIVLQIRQIVKDIAMPPGDAFRISFGSFDVLATGKDPRLPGTIFKPSEENARPSQAAKNFQGKIDGKKNENSSDGFFANIFSVLGEIGVEFPLLENPLLAFNLLMGQTADLVTYDFLGSGEHDRLEAGFDWSVSFGPIIPPVPLFAKIFAGFNVFADISRLGHLWPEHGRL